MKKHQRNTKQDQPNELITLLLLTLSKMVFAITVPKKSALLRTMLLSATHVVTCFMRLVVQWKITM